MPAIDKREAVDTPEGFKWVYQGPMVDVDLPDGEVDQCPEPNPIMALAMMEGQNEFGTMLVLQKSSRLAKEPRGPLDSVSISEYIEGWRAHGAKIGKFTNGKYVFDE